LKSRPLGSAGPEISVLGIGSWAAGGPGLAGWGNQDDRDSIRAIQRAVERGANWIDTAPAYGLGHAEEVVGRTLRSMTEQQAPLVFTKCGLRWTGTGYANDLRPSAIRRECQASLRRLGRDQIDVYFVHWPDASRPIEEAWTQMARLVDEGLVRWLGLSNCGVDELTRCEVIRHVDCVQPRLNLLDQQSAAELLPASHAAGTGAVVYSPMASGLLTGRLTKDKVAAFDDGDWRRRSPDFAEPKLSATLAVVERLELVAKSAGTSLPALAVAWVLTVAGVSGAIVGARSPDQVDDWIGAAELELEPERITQLAALAST
jgi:aryl-alcohol dehydrogenase-like predicted oxidoreductase